jgi:hypothetical protein
MQRLEGPGKEAVQAGSDIAEEFPWSIVTTSARPRPGARREDRARHTDRTTVPDAPRVIDQLLLELRWIRVQIRLEESAWTLSD